MTSPTPFGQLPTVELGERLTSELLLVGEGWTSRKDLMRIVMNWTMSEAEDLVSAGVELPRGFARVTNLQVYAALREAGVRETRWNGMWGFVARPQDNTGPEFERFLTTKLHNGVGLQWMFTPQTELYNAYCAMVPAGVAVMSMTKFIAAMKADGYGHVRRWTVTEDPKTGRKVRDRQVWGFREVALK